MISYSHKEEIPKNRKTRTEIEKQSIEKSLSKLKTDTCKFETFRKLKKSKNRNRRLTKKDISTRSRIRSKWKIFWQVGTLNGSKPIAFQILEKHAGRIKEKRKTKQKQMVEKQKTNAKEMISAKNISFTYIPEQNEIPRAKRQSRIHQKRKRMFQAEKGI